MSKSSQAPAYFRTGTPMAAGSIIVFVANTFGMDLTVDQALILAPVVMFGYYVLGRALETYNPKLGYVLGIAKQPAYSKEDAPAPEKGEDLVAVVVPEGDPVPEPEPEVEAPVQTDNGPKEGDEIILPAVNQTFSGGMR